MSKKVVTANKPGGTITNQLFKTLTKNFPMRFEAALDVLCANSGKRFSEEQSYGLIVQSLCDHEDSNKRPQFVLTELPVRRKAKDETSPGHLDMLVYISKQMIAVEVKLRSRGLASEKTGTKEIMDAWYKPKRMPKHDDAVGQLRTINMGSRFFRGIRSKSPINKFPLLIVCFVRSHKTADKEPLKNPEEIVKKAHNSVIAALETYKGSTPSYRDWKPVSPVSRQSAISGRSITIYGLGFYGGAAKFENVNRTKRRPTSR